MTELFSTNETDGITQAWLRQYVRQPGTSLQGEVVAVDIQSTGAFNSHTNYLKRRYSDDSPLDAPIGSSTSAGGKTPTTSSSATKFATKAFR